MKEPWPLSSSHTLFLLCYRWCVLFVLAVDLAVFNMLELAIDLAVFNKISAFVLICMRMIQEVMLHLIAISVAIFYVLAINLAVFNNKISAFLLICMRMILEAVLYLIVISAAVLMTSSTLSCLEQPINEFKYTYQGFLSRRELIFDLLRVRTHEDIRSESTMALLGAWCFMIICVVFLINVLLAQLMCAYGASMLLTTKPDCDQSSVFVLRLPSSLPIWAQRMALQKSGVGISSMGVMRPDMVMRSIIPVFLTGVLGIYGLITAVNINGNMDAKIYSAYSGYAHLGAGLTVGMSSLAAGLAIGRVGNVGVRANAQQPRLFVGMIQEVVLNVIAVIAVLLMTCSAVSCFEQPIEDGRLIRRGLLETMSLWELNLRLLDVGVYKKTRGGFLIFVGCWCFLIVCVVFLISKFSAQLVCAYQSIHDNMVGYARLKHIRIVIECVPNVSSIKWRSFVFTLVFMTTVQATTATQLMVQSKCIIDVAIGGYMFGLSTIPDECGRLQHEAGVIPTLVDDTAVALAKKPMSDSAGGKVFLTSAVVQSEHRATPSCDTSTMGRRKNEFSPDELGPRCKVAEQPGSGNPLVVGESLAGHAPNASTVDVQSLRAGMMQSSCIVGRSITDDSTTSTDESSVASDIGACRATANLRTACVQQDFSCSSRILRIFCLLRYGPTFQRLLDNIVTCIVLLFWPVLLVMLMLYVFAFCIT